MSLIIEKPFIMFVWETSPARQGFAASSNSFSKQYTNSKDFRIRAMMLYCVLKRQTNVPYLAAGLVLVLFCLFRLSVSLPSLPPPLSKYIINMSVYSSPAPVNFLVEGIKSCILFHS